MERTVTVQIDKTVNHRTDTVHHKKFINKQVQELRSNGFDIWMVLSSRDVVQIIHRDSLSDGAPKVMSWRFPSFGNVIEIHNHNNGDYMRVVSETD